MKVIRCSVDTLGKKITTKQLAEAFKQAIQVAGFEKNRFERDVAVLQGGPAGVTLSMYHQDRQDLTLFCLVHGDASDPIFFAEKSYGDIYIATMKNPRREESQSAYEQHLGIHQIGIFQLCQRLAEKMTVLLSDVELTTRI